MAFLTKKRVIILAIIVICGILAGRIVLRAVMNMMLGGTLFGGNFL